MSMVSAVYCNDCGIRNNPAHMNCKMCEAKLPMPVRQNPLYAKITEDRPKAVVFDLDMTLFDNTQRFTDAIRAGLVDKKGKPQVKGMMSKKQAWNKRNKFIYSKKELAKDVAIPGATQLVSDLKNDGYTIIYLTARPNKYQEQTVQQLESNGFPLFRDREGDPLVFSKPADKTQTPAFKANKVRELLGNYTVEMVFDDKKANLEEIAKLGIPGLYASLSDHVRHNPHNKYGGQNTLTSDPDNDDEMIDPDDEDNKIFDVERTVGDNMNPMGPLPNPGEIRRNFLGFGKKKEKKSQDDQMMKEYKNFLQKHWQGEPFEFHQGEKWPNWKKFNPDSHPNAVFSSSQIGAGNSLLIYNHATAHAKKSHDFKRVMKEQKAAIKKIPTGYKPKPKGITIYIDRELSLDFHSKETIKDINTAKKFFKESDLKVLKMPGIYDRDMEDMMGKLFGHESLVDKKITKGDMKAEKIHAAIHSKDFAAQGGWPLVVVDGWRIGGLDHLKAWSKSEMSNKYKKAKSKTNPGVKTNPAHPSKVEKAKKLYKHMNGKEPAKIEKKKVDLGDVWYQVGEGGCWQIGYISGKDDGREDQKYTHVFNEETKDGNYPKLYATMPENGKPMLIITGGTWKIKTDATGTAWIYD